MVRRLLMVRLLGGFTAELDGRRIPDETWRRRRAAALIKLLALAPHHRVVRDEAMDALWPNLGAAAGGANLRKAALHARRMLGADDAVVLDGVTVRLMPGADVITDVAGFESAAHAALTHGGVEQAREAAALYTGDLLPDDLYEPWCERRREQLRARCLQVLAAGRLWGRLLAMDPSSELAHREIMRERLAAGDRAGAIRQFDQLRTVLRDKLGVSPDRESVALYERVLAVEGHDVPTPAERARALLAWGTVHWERSDLVEAERAARQVRALAVDAGLGGELAEASELLGLVAYAQGQWREVFGREFIETIRRSPELAPFVYDANMCMNEFALHELDGMEHIADFARELLTTADAADSAQARALGLLLRGEVGLFAGADDAAVRADLTESARLHRVSSSPTGVTLATVRLAQTETARGRMRSAERLHRQALQLAAESAVGNHLLPLVYGGMLQGVEPAVGLAILDEADAALADFRLDGARLNVRRGGPPAGRLCDPCSMSLRLGAATVHARTGHHDRALAHLAEAERIADLWQGGPWWAAVTEARAALLRCRDGSADEVRPLLETAAKGFAAAGRGRDAARCEAALDALR